MPDLSFTLAQLHDFEANLVEALDSAIEAEGLASIEMQRSESRTGHRFELSAELSGDTEETDIDHNGHIYYSRYTLQLMVTLRTPLDDFEAHRSARSRFRALMARPRGLCWLGDHLPMYEIQDIRAQQTLTGAENSEESQDELYSEMGYWVKIRIPPSAIAL